MTIKYIALYIMTKQMILCMLVGIILFVILKTAQKTINT